MASAARSEWDTTAKARLDELEQVHVAAHGTNRGRRWGTDQLNRSMFLTLSAQFQTYCRDLHDEAVEVHVTNANARQEAVLRKLLTQGRKLDVGNPRTDALENDFSRLGFKLLPALRAKGVLTVKRLEQLDVLIDFRNLISHGQETSIQAYVASEDIAATLGSYRRHRSSLTGLVGTMDRVVSAELKSGLQIPAPW